MVDPLRYLSFQAVLQDWCNKDRGMCYPVCEKVHMKDPVIIHSRGSFHKAILATVDLSYLRLVIRCQPLYLQAFHETNFKTIVNPATAKIMTSDKIKCSHVLLFS